VPEEPFLVPIDGGVLHGHRGGSGPPALVLHGGAAVPDYTGPLAAELQDRFTTHRYTQRGTPPSTGSPPYTIETHTADAVAVLDHHELDRAWAIGHSWGGHLALHLLVAHPERLLGVVCIDVLGADGSIFEDVARNFRRTMSREDAARVEEIEALRREGRATEADLLERFNLVWPHYFSDPARAAPNPANRIGARASTETNASIAQHYERRTLAEGLPRAHLPVLFVHGERDPLPPRSAHDTAALIPGARVVVLAGLGHFPWLEEPGVIGRCLADELDA
jgi:proline iminopeptidase